MAAELPDSHDFKSWEDAFLHPVPIVHRLEQQLRAELTTNQQKLRTLVGASYRDLLGTAERIVQMDGEMQEVDMHLGNISRKCNSRALDNITRNYGVFDENMRKQDNQRYAFASQLAVLQACPVVISRLVRKGSSSLLAAKVLVLSRLLHKALSRDLQSPPLVENIRNQLASLRRHLLRHVDRQLSNQNAGISAVVQAMCAFALATSSSLKEVLRHFHHVRLQAITSQLEQSNAKSRHILKALKLYIRTIQDTQAIVPKRLVESLVRLKSIPLLKNPDIRSAMELNLEIHERWISEDIQIFTPWIRHDDLGKSEIDTILKDWAKVAFSTLSAGLRHLLSSMEDFHALVKLRTEILETWLNGSHKIAKFTSVEALEGLRAAINGQLMELIQKRAHRLQLVGAGIIAVLDDWKAGVTDSREDLWSSSTTSMDISNGALSFKRAIVDRSQGRNGAVLRVMHDYEAWLQFISDIATVIKAIGEQKWDDDLDDVEDQFDVEYIIAQLNEEDPKLLESQLAKTLNTAFQELEVVITGAEARCGQGSQAIFVLRVLREMRQRIPSQGKSANFALSVVPRLHNKLAKAVSHSTLNSFQNLLKRRKWARSVPARALWEGSPQLPILPSPGVFKLLHGLVTAMSEHGNDVWSPAAVQTIKGHVRGHVYSLLQTTLESIERLTAVADEPTQKERDQTRSDLPSSNMSDEWAVQLLFDVIFLERVLSATNSSDKPSNETLDGLIKTLEEKAMLTTPLKERLQKASQEYWKRTYLLFAYLA